MILHFHQLLLRLTVGLLLTHSIPGAISACANQHSACDSARDLAFEDQRWSFLSPTQALSLSFGTTLDACCQDCKQLDSCIIFDHNAGSQRCRMYALTTGFDSKAISLAEENGTQSLFFNSGNWTGKWSADSFQAVAVQSQESCLQQCQFTCGCRFWQYDADALQCQLFREQANGFIPRLRPQDPGAQTVAGVLLGPSLDMTLQDTNFDWDRATVSEEYTKERYQVVYNPQQVNISKAAVDVSEVHYQWAPNNTLFNGWSQNLSMQYALWPKDLQSIIPDYVADQLNFSLPLYLPAQDAADADDSTYYLDHILTLKLPKPVTIAPNYMPKIKFNVTLVDISVPLTLSFDVGVCTAVKLDFLERLDARLTPLAILERGGFCGEAGDLDEEGGTVLVSGVLTFQMPIKVDSIATEPIGSSCPANWSTCGGNTTITNRRWNFLSYNTYPQPVDDFKYCCQHCSEDTNCVFFDYNTTSKTCNFYDWSLSLFSITTQTSNNLYDLLTYSQIPIVEEHGFLAGFIDRKLYKDRKWSMQYDAVVPVPLTSNGPQFCSTACETMCGCTYWNLDSNSNCYLFKSKITAQLWEAPGYIAGHKLGSSLIFSQRQVSRNSMWAEDDETDDEDELQKTFYVVTYNQGADEELDKVDIPLDVSWTANATLYRSFSQGNSPSVSFTLDGRDSVLCSSSLVDDDASRDTPVGPLSLPMVRGSSNFTTYPCLQLPANYSVASLTQVNFDIQTTVRRVSIPLLLTFDVQRCGIVTPTDADTLQQLDGITGITGSLGSAQARPIMNFQRFIDMYIPLDALLTRGGFCGTLGLGVLDGVEACVQVTGTADMLLPVMIKNVTAAVQGKDNTVDGTGCLPRFGYDYPGGDINSGTCNQVDRWEDCCAACTAVPNCVAWSYDLPSDSSSTCPRHCALKSMLNEPVQDDDSVAGTVLGVFSSCEVRTQNMALLSSDPESDVVVSASLVSRCCAACQQSDSCMAWTYNWTGECTLKRSVQQAYLENGAISGFVNRDKLKPHQPPELIMTDSGDQTMRAQQPLEWSIVRIPAGGSIVSDVLVQYDVSWQAVCCANVLDSCENVSLPSTFRPMLIPPPHAAETHCDLVQRTAVAATTVGGCRCLPYYSYVSGGRAYNASASCLSVASPGGGNSPFCYVDSSTCNQDVQLGQYQGYDYDTCATGTQAGCELLVGVGLVAYDSNMQPTSGLNNGAQTVVPSLNDCCQWCQVTQSCKYFTFLPLDNSAQPPYDTPGNCWLKSSVTNTARLPNGISGISRKKPDAAASGRRLQQSQAGEACPSTFPMRAGDSMVDLPASVTQGLSWPALCCYNTAVTNCTDLEADVILFIPCGTDISNNTSCPGTGEDAPVKVVHESTNAAIPTAVGIGVSAASLLIGAALGYLMARHWLKQRRAKYELQRKQLTVAHQIARGYIVKAAVAESKAEKYTWSELNVEHTSSSVLVAGMQHSSGTNVVAKFYTKPEAFLRERSLLNTNLAPGALPDVVDTFNSRSAPNIWSCIVMERGDYSANKWLAMHMEEPPTLQSRKALLRSLGEALLTLHENNMVHGDVCLDHVMWFNLAYTWKLVGLRNWQEVGGRLKPQCHIRYAAPEVAKAMLHKEELMVRTASDMWSFGVIMWEVMTGEPLFGWNVSDEDVGAMLCGDKPLPFEKHKALWMAFEEEQVRRLCQQLLRRSPAERWRMARVLNSVVLRVDESAQQAQLTQHAAKRIKAIRDKLRNLKEVDVQTLKQSYCATLAVTATFEEMVERMDGADMWEDAMPSYVDLTDAKASKRQSVVYEDYLSGMYKTLAAPTSLLNTIESAAQGGGVPADDAPMLLHHNSLYAIRLVVRYGGNELLDVPVDAVQSISLDGEFVEEEVVLPVWSIQEECDEHVWTGFAVWNTSDHPLGKQELDMTMTVKLKSADEIVNVHKKVVAHVFTSDTSFALERTGAQLKDMWEAAPEWLKLTAYGVTALYNL